MMKKEKEPSWLFWRTKRQPGSSDRTRFTLMHCGRKTFTAQMTLLGWSNRTLELGVYLDDDSECTLGGSFGIPFLFNIGFNFDFRPGKLTRLITGKYQGRETEVRISFTKDQCNTLRFHSLIMNDYEQESNPKSLLGRWQRWRGASLIWTWEDFWNGKTTHRFLGDYQFGDYCVPVKTVEGEVVNASFRLTAEEREWTFANPLSKPVRRTDYILRSSGDVEFVQAGKGENSWDCGDSTFETIGFAKYGMPARSLTSAEVREEIDKYLKENHRVSVRRVVPKEKSEHDSVPGETGCQGGAVHQPGIA